MGVMVTWLLGMAALGSVMGLVGPKGLPLHGSLDGYDLVLQTDKGVLCTGTLVRTDAGGGLGHLDCADGRSGSFSWTITGKGSASAAGSLGGETLELFIHQG